MLTSILTALATNVALGWLWRRVQELAAWLFGLAPLFLALPPEQQHVIMEILQGRAGGLSVSAYAGLAYYLFTQWQSWRATTQPQLVTSDRRKIALPTLTENQALDMVEAHIGRRPNTVPK